MGSPTSMGLDTLMTDKEILDEVYHQLVWTNDNWQHMNMDRLFDKIHDMKDTIEQEWQRADEEASGNYDMDVLR